MPSRHPLTERQKAILDFIAEHQSRRGIPPTHREICEHFGYSSYGTVHKHLRLLQDKGYLDRRGHQKRGLRLLVDRPGDSHLQEIPFLGRIAAGRPIEALPEQELLSVPPHLLGSATAEHYVLQVVGDSMIGEGIHDGDFVVVQRRELAETGAMVVALVGEDATLKRIYPEGAEVRLQPANPQMEPLRVPASEVQVQGVVVGLMRRF
jgi:repressor LexA